MNHLKTNKPQVYAIMDSKPYCITPEQFNEYFTSNVKIKMVTKQAYLNLRNRQTIVWPFIVTKINQPEPIGTYYRIQKGMSSFNTTINPIVDVPYKHQVELLENAMADYIDMCNDDYSEAKLSTI